MNHHVKDFYKQFSDESPNGNFHKVIALHEAPDIDWSQIHLQVPSLPRGWFELARLNVSDRIEFTNDFWVAKLPYHKALTDFLTKFFDSVEDIQVFLVQQKFDDPFQSHLVYNLKNNAGFFKGCPPSLETDLLQMETDFSGLIFPNDYLKFLQIHDGFCKTTDCTGILSSKIIRTSYDMLQTKILELGKVVTNTKGEVINPHSLIPFYESFGMPFYQCFYKDWYPETEMGNIYYSGNTNTISDVKNKDPSSEAMAFSTFSDWLIFYLETIS